MMSRSTFRRSVVVVVAAASMTWLSGGVSIAHDDFGYGGGGTAASRMAAPVPDGADIEVPERSGIGGSERFRFTPRGDLFTVAAMCRGDGPAALQLDDPARPGVDGSSLRCDGVPTSITVVTRGGAQQLSVDATDDTAWAIAFYNGEAPAINVTASRR